MKQKISPSEKFDSTYKKETSAIWVSIVILIVGLLVQYNPPDNPEGVKVVLIIIESLCAIYAYRIADRLNVSPFWVGVAGFFFSIPTLIILGFSRKRNLEFEIDNSYPPETQLLELRKYAKSFSDKGKIKEAVFVYEYLIENLPYIEEDKFVYSDLLTQIPQSYEKSKK